MSSTLSLAELPDGDSGVVVELGVDGPLRQRLMDLGFLPGTAVTPVRRAPLGDPHVYLLRGTRLCLRKSEARNIRVRRCG